MLDERQRGGGTQSLTSVRDVASKSATLPRRASPRIRSIAPRCHHRRRTRARAAATAAAPSSQHDKRNITLQYHSVYTHTTYMCNSNNNNNSTRSIRTRENVPRRARARTYAFCIYNTHGTRAQPPCARRRKHNTTRTYGIVVIIIVRRITRKENILRYQPTICGISYRDRRHGGVYLGFFFCFWEQISFSLSVLEIYINKTRNRRPERAREEKDAPPTEKRGTGAPVFGNRKWGPWHGGGGVGDRSKQSAAARALGQDRAAVVTCAAETSVWTAADGGAGRGRQRVALAAAAAAAPGVRHSKSRATVIATPGPCTR